MSAYFDFDDHWALRPVFFPQRWKRHCRLRREALGNPGLGHSFPWLDHQYSQRFILSGRFPFFGAFGLSLAACIRLCYVPYVNEIRSICSDPFFPQELPLGISVLGLCDVSHRILDVLWFTEDRHPSPRETTMRIHVLKVSFLTVSKLGEIKSS
ncbi:hypothetical protein Tco_0020483 [Tanacetum coccineum]